MKLFSLLVLLVSSSMSYAFTVSPGELELSVTGEDSTGLFVVENKSKVDANIASQTFRKKFNEYGEEQRTSLKNELLIFPVTLKVKAGGKSVVRVVYIGNKKIDEQVNYRIVFSDLDPVRYGETRDGKHTKLNALLSYGQNISVKPEKIDKQALQAAPKDQDGKKYIELKNPGNVNVLAKGILFKVFVDQKKDPIRFEGRRFKALAAAMHPKSTRLIPLPDELLNLKINKIELDDGE